MTKPLAYRQASHLALTLVTGFSAAFTQCCFLFGNRCAMGA